MGAIVAAGCLHAGVLWLLVDNMGLDMTRRLDEAMQVVEIGPPPPPPIVPPPPPPPKRSKQPDSEGAPPNLRSVATPVVAPPPIVRLPVPPPITATETPGIGAQATAGNAEVAGPGTGAGGTGNGLGTGSWGPGDGGGGLDDETPPRWRRGRLKDSDYPRGLGEAGISGRVSVRYLVDVDGRVARCTVTRSSGSADLDDTTCRLIRERFRFDPSRDRQGNPVAATIVESHEWLSRDDEAGGR